MRPVAVGIEINYREPGMLCTTTRMRKEGKRTTIVEVWVARGTADILGLLMIEGSIEGLRDGERFIL